MATSDLHTPVMLDRCIELLAPAISRPGAIAIDATLGMGGHSEAMLERFEGLQLIGIDRDPDAIRLAGERLGRFGDRVTLVHAVYDELDHALQSAGIESVEGILFDLGVSSLQLDEADRGFAYAKDAPLDMRMDQTGELTAERIISDWSAAELARIFRDYGDERLALRYAQHIVAARQESPVDSSAKLVDILQDATPARLKNAGHPAKRVFQALRIAVNRELEVLETALPAALEALAVDGRIVVMSYQSHEDRMVKRVLRDATTSSSPAGLPVELPEYAAEFTLLTRGAERAAGEEQSSNPRSIPARLRAAQRVGVRSRR
ncbi:16S rRNA (cytosine(1402)-N(4))-methyltransferase RsmH [uncultured Agrococcus sp.]|uniref:16S rRNA (cytosine(1402)-N(4))-methyltransferase RsmH n=1 Tax=uncultured Agrococcus sp. TaxID=382258 RepID=UPI0025E3E835|nr:16S rRNA (cytosine(1402)-N(4))-methyltransferase RsmH [uncultured Agrococcus sp.]